RPELDDARVTAGSLGVARRDVVEEALDDGLLAQEGNGLPTRVEVAALAQRDHLLGHGPHFLGLGQGRADAAVHDQLRGQVGVQRLAVRTVAPELAPALLVSHQSSPRSLRLCTASVSRTSSIDFLPKFGIAASSCSVLEIRSPIVSIPTRLRQLYERTPSSSSSIRMFSIPWASGISGSSAPTGEAAARLVRSLVSMFVKIASCRISTSAACSTASRGVTEPSV